MDNIVIDGAGVGAVVGLVEVFKTLGIRARFAPLLSLAAGISYAFAMTTGDSIPLIIFRGIVTGLSASGLYSGTKATIAK